MTITTSFVCPLFLCLSRGHHVYAMTFSSHGTSDCQCMRFSLYKTKPLTPNQPTTAAPRTLLPMARPILECGKIDASCHNLLFLMCPLTLVPSCICPFLSYYSFPIRKKELFLFQACTMLFLINRSKVSFKTSLEFTFSYFQLSEF